MKKQIAAAAAAIACLSAFGFTGCTQEEVTDAPGTYSVDAQLKCYVAAMGGIEFGAPLLSGTEYTVAEDGSMTLTAHFIKNSVTIYSITCYTFIDASPYTGAEPTEGEAEDGTIGCYDADLNLVTQGVEYTLSEDTATNPAGEEVSYVDSITFPISEKTDTYYLTFYINSQVMGTQFKVTADGSTSRAATLTVDWTTMREGA